MRKLSFSALQSMRRILVALSTYRQQTADLRDPICSRGVNAYFKKQLTIEDWIFWQRIQVENLLERQDLGTETPACPWQLKQLLGHYRQAGRELGPLWRQHMHGLKEPVSSQEPIN